MAEPQKQEASKAKRGFLGDLLDEAFDLQHGLWQTFRTLITSPSRVIRAYIDDSIENYYPPVKWLVLSTTIVTLLFFTVVDFSAILNENIEASLKESSAQLSEEDHQQTRMFAKYSALVFTKLNNDYSTIVTLLVMLPSFTLFSWLFYRRRFPGFSHHMGMNAYFIGEVNLIQSILVLPMFLLSNAQIRAIHYLTWIDLSLLLYFLYAYYRQFPTKRVLSWIIPLVVILLGLVLYYIIMIAISVGAGVFMALREGA